MGLWAFSLIFCRWMRCWLMLLRAGGGGQGRRRGRQLERARRGSAEGEETDERGAFILTGCGTRAGANEEGWLSGSARRALGRTSDRPSPQLEVREPPGPRPLGQAKGKGRTGLLRHMVRSLAGSTHGPALRRSPDVAQHASMLANWGPHVGTNSAGGGRGEARSARARRRRSRRNRNGHDRFLTLMRSTLSGATMAACVRGLERGEKGELLAPETTAALDRTADGF